MTDTENAEQAEPTEGLMSLSDVYNDEPAEVETETPEQEQVETKPEEPKGEAEQETEAKAEETEKPVEPPSTEDSGQLAALLAERDKRQKLEKELEELRAKVTPEEIPDPIENPQEYAAYIESKATQSELGTRITLSRDVLREVDPDFDRLEGVFMGMVMNSDGEIIDQGLLAQFQQSANPAKFARDKAKEHEEIAKLRDPKYRETLEAEIRAKVLEDLQKEKDKISSAVVPDLTKASAGQNSSKTVEPKTLDDVFEGAAL